MSHEEFLGCARAALASGSAPEVKAALIPSEPRYAPDRELDALHVALELDVDLDRRSVRASCRTTLRAFKNGVREASFDAVGLELARIKVQGRPARYKHKDGKLTVSLSRALAEGETVEVQADYAVHRPKTGLHFVSTEGRRTPDQLWSQSQPEDARFWFPCHDSPHEKATSEMRISVPRGFRAISNGVLQRAYSSGARTTYHWKMDQPHAIYLISVAVGRFSEIEERWGDVRVLYYCPKGREKHARQGFRKTVLAIDYFSKATGVPYPYQKYAQVAAAQFPGGMENTTCTTQTDAILIPPEAAIDTDMDYLVAHELAHQWFGNLVTCRDWAHAWLNEGFATYFEILFTAFDKGWDEAEDELEQNAQAYFYEDAHRYRRAVVTPHFKFPWVLFDRHTYEKGSWILHMLRRELGDELWWKSIRHYLTKHRNQSVETSDLVTAIAEATGRNVKSFIDRWVHRAGYPSLRIQYRWDPKRSEAVLRVRQTQESSAEAPLFKLNADILFTGRGWTRRFTRKVEKKEESFAFSLPSAPVNVEFDPEHGILKKELFAKPYSMWACQLLSAPSALSRAKAARQVARWGGKASLRLLLAAFRREKYWGTRREIIAAIGSIRGEDAYQAVRGLAAVKHPKLRRAAVEALGGYQRPASASLLRRLAIKDPSLHVAAAALRGLGKLQDPAHRGLLLGKLKAASYRDLIGSGAISGLLEMRDPSLLPALRRASLPPFLYPARASALRALAELNPFSEKIIGWLADAAADADERVRLVAISALGQLEDERALPALREARKSACSRTQTYAAEAIARIGEGEKRKT